MKKKEFPVQRQSLPGKQSKMKPEPEVIKRGYKGSYKLQDKVALITGGDSGIGRSVLFILPKKELMLQLFTLKKPKMQTTQKNG